MTGRTVYLLHFERPLGDPTRPHAHASHYVGSAADLTLRLEEHAAGRGARIVAACVERGIGVELVRCWSGGRDVERRIKRLHNHRRLCPVCRPALGRFKTERRFTCTPIGAGDGAAEGGNA